MKKEQVLETILVIASGLLAVSVIFNINALKFAALAILLVSLFSGYFAEKTAMLWLGTANILGRINSFILLTAVFYLVLTPVALLRRLLGSEDLSMNRTEQESYYFDRNHEYRPEDFENSW